MVGYAGHRRVRVLVGSEFTTHIHSIQSESDDAKRIQGTP